MHAIILAAGRGERMGNLTGHRPKCLTTLAGRTLLEWQLDALHATDIRDIAIVRGYRAESINPAECTLLNNSKWNESNMVSSLACAYQWLEQYDCIVSYSDIVYHPKIPKHLSEHHGDLVIHYDKQWLSLWSQRFDNPLDDAETFRIDNNGILETIGKRAKSICDIQGQYMGLLKISPLGWDQIKGLLDKLPKNLISRLDMTTMLRLLVESGIKINTISTNGRWCEVDSENDLRVYEKNLSNFDWMHDWRW